MKKRSGEFRLSRIDWRISICFNSSRLKIIRRRGRSFDNISSANFFPNEPVPPVTNTLICFQSMMSPFRLGIGRQTLKWTQTRHSEGTKATRLPVRNCDRLEDPGMVEDQTKSLVGLLC